MKIVILDGKAENPGDLSWEEIEKLGETVIYDSTPIGDDEEIIKRIGDAEVVVVNKTPISRNTLDKCPSIKFIAVLATGTDIVDKVAAKEKNVPVSNVPVYGIYSVSQFAIALLLELCSQIGHHSQSVHSGCWEKSGLWTYWDTPQVELYGKTYGLIGCGNIGVHVAQIAHALGMNILVYDINKRDEVKDFAEYVELDELFRRSDVVGLHMPLLPFNVGIINKDNIAKMKDGVIIINNSRGGMVVEEDLANALKSGKVAGAGLDVVSSEPIKGENPLLSAPNCIITPHMSWGAKESRERIMNATAENIKAYIDGNPKNVVNR